MEWPYASLRRNRLPPGERPIAVAEYNFLDRPYGTNRGVREVPEGDVVRRATGSRATGSWTRRQHPTTGTPYSWVRARVLGGKTNFWGRGALRYGPLQFNAASRDGFDVDWPISLRRREAVLRQGGRAARLLGHERRARCRCRTASSSGRSKLNCVEVAFKRAIAKMGRHYIPGRAGVTTEGVLNNKYRARCAGRGRCGRGCDISAALPLADRARLPGARQRQPDRSGRTRSSPKCSSTRRPNRASGVRVIDANTREVMDFKAPVVVLGAGALDTTRILLNSRVAPRIRTASAIRRDSSAAT